MTITHVRSIPTFHHERSDEERIAHIRNRALKRHRAPVPGLPAEVAEGDQKEGQPGASVVAGAQTSFLANLPLKSRRDVQTCCLYAQYAANAEASRERQPEAWYESYVDELGILGWLFESFSFSRYQAGGTGLTMDTAVLDILAAVLTGGASEVAMAAIQGLKDLAGDSGPVKLFNSESTSATNGAFQLGTAWPENGDVVMGLGGFHFHTEKQVTRILWFEFTDQDTYLYKATAKVILDTKAFNAVRDVVEDRVQEFREDSIRNTALKKKS